MKKQTIESLEFTLNNLTCKYIQKRNSYESTRFVFNVERLEATSYDWWTMFKVGRSGKLWINSCTYSRETSRHFRHLRSILDIEFLFKKQKLNWVYCRQGLHNIRGAIASHLKELYALEFRLNKANKLNKKRIDDSITEVKKEIEALTICGRDLGQRVHFNKVEKADLKAEAIQNVESNIKLAKQKREIEKQRRLDSEKRKQAAIAQFLNPKTNNVEVSNDHA